MKNILKKLLIGTIAVMLLLSTVLVAVGCVENNPSGGTTQKYDPETRPITFAISALDGTFNPFFTTSATDSSIAGFTQVGMLGTTNDGQVACGEDEPVVTLDYKITSYDKHNNETENGEIDHTTYEFVIKNGMKFSDGVDLTIDDVLFNMYVYLDPMYSGSSTMYSVDIQGLKAYRYNDIKLSDNATMSDATFRNKALQRVDDLLEWNKNNIKDDELTEQMLSDIESVKAQLLKDLKSDWTTNEGTIESNYKEYPFTEDWESYYLIQNLIQVKYDTNEKGHYVAVKENGKYVMEDYDAYKEIMANVDNDEETIAEYMSENGCNRDEAIKLIKKDIAIQTAYDSYADEGVIKGQMATILTGMSTGSNIIAEWTLEEQSKYYEGQTGNVKSISGITTKKVSSFNGVNGTELKAEHDVLSITINGIDPKAIWSFAFAVAPMHYYSNAETIANKTDYPYGVKARDKDFFDKVLNSPEKNALPVGAGAYRASNKQGNASADPSKVVAKDFWSNKQVYFERNDYFYTLGEEIENAKIRRLTYIEVSENNILNNLITGAIDYGTPSATLENKGKIAQESSLGSIEYMTSGYGYVGINPKYVQDIEVRRAIMMSFNTESVIGDYYGGTMAETILRPMSKLSWAYPTDSKAYYEYDATGLKIEALVESAGYEKGSDGIYEKNGKKLKFKFTIAGDTTEHPAYSMFLESAKLLNAHGFEITVGTDIQALKKLSTGGLEVWAAAWTSTIDPDMYQIYHKDSKTTNVKNWNYDGILNDSTGTYDREKTIIDELSDLIDKGRETNSKTDRSKIYKQALDKIMELAVEYPTYQRKDLVVFNKDVIDSSTLNLSDDLKYSSPTDRIWEVDYN